MVEAQRRVSTMKLVDDFNEQRTLEELLDASKPPVPAECRHLDYLLFTPFRYAARGDSRFRRAGRTPGVFYAAERIETSVAEVAFWRLLFFIESPGLAWPANPLEFTGFVVRYKTEHCVDLTKAPDDADPDAGPTRPTIRIATPSPTRRAALARLPSCLVRRAIQPAALPSACFPARRSTRFIRAVGQAGT